MNDLKQYLYDKNEICPNCRWCKDLKCVNFACNWLNMDIEYAEIKGREYYYPLVDSELFGEEDEETGSLF